MNEYFVYLLKSSAILGIFWAIYALLLRNETFFRFMRIYLLAGIVLAFVLPGLNWVEYTDIEFEALPLSTYSQLPDTETIPTAQARWPLTPSTLALGLYSLGVLAILLRRTLSFYQIAWLGRLGEQETDSGLKIFNVNAPIPPFSFFNRIFWNPELYNEEERVSILRHEEAHCRQLHSIDIVLMELGLMMLWWNPIAWLYRKALRQNLEYLADRSVRLQGLDQTTYQYALLKLSAPEHAPLLASTFSNSFIKKRILMLNRKPSHPRKALLFSLVVPVLALFLYSFNRTEIVRYIPSGSTELFPESVLGERVVEIEISPETTEAELQQIKDQLSKDGIDFTYTSMRNPEGALISLDLRLSGTWSSGKKFSGSFNVISEEGPISPVLLSFDDMAEEFFVGSRNHLRMNKGGANGKMKFKASTITIREDGDSEDKEGTFIYRMAPDAENEEYILTDSTQTRIHFKGKAPGNPTVFVLDSVVTTASTPGKTEWIGHRGFAQNVKVIRMPLDRKSIRKLKKEVRKARKSGDEGEVEYIILTDRNNDLKEMEFDVEIDGFVWNAEDLEGVEQALSQKMDPEEIQRIAREAYTNAARANKEAMEISRQIVIGQREELSAQSEEQARLIEEEMLVQMKKAKEEMERARKEMERTLQEMERTRAEFVEFRNGTPMYLIDGKEVGREEFDKLEPDDIKSIDVLKGKSAIEKYGEKAKDGVISISLKK